MKKLNNLIRKAERHSALPYKYKFLEDLKMKYVCDLCGWEYDEAVGDPDLGIEPGTAFADLPDDFECPLCGAGKDDFSEA